MGDGGRQKVDGANSTDAQKDAAIAAAQEMRATGTSGDATTVPLAALWKPLGSLGDWFNTDPPRRDYLLTMTEGEKTSGVLPLGKVGMLAAAGSAGKSWLATQLALSVATGRDWIGFQVPNPGRVLLVLGEEDAEEAQRRIYRAAQLMRLNADEQELARRRLWVLPMAGRPVALTCEENARALRQGDDGARGPADPADGLPVTPLFWDLLERLETEPDEPWRLIVLDPLSRFAGLEVEKDSAHATRFVQAVERFASIPSRPTVLLTHHTNKTSRSEGQSKNSDAAAATAARGSSALTDGVRWQASLEPKRRYEGAPELVDFKVVKNNYGRYPPDVLLVREEGPLRTSNTEEWKQWKRAEADAKAREKGGDDSDTQDKPRRDGRTTSPTRTDWGNP